MADKGKMHRSCTLDEVYRLLNILTTCFGSGVSLKLIASLSAKGFALLSIALIVCYMHPSCHTVCLQSVPIFLLVDTCGSVNISLAPSSCKISRVKLARC